MSKSTEYSFTYGDAVEQRDNEGQWHAVGRFSRYGAVHGSAHVIIETDSGEHIEVATALESLRPVSNA